ncbi:hypothetical protein CPB86DRAFT_796891 [Serendipita vermifera]|nr:hypothetical protein CPB86DRAFT_796891 [Serendipita vermifera]
MLSSGTPGEVEMQSSLGLEWERHSSKLSTEMKTVDSGAQLLSPHTYTYTNNMSRVYAHHGDSIRTYNHTCLCRWDVFSTHPELPELFYKRMISESQYKPPNGGAYVPFGVPEDHYLSVPWERQFPSPNEHQRSVHIPNTSWDDPQNLTKKSHMSDYWGHPHLDEHLIQSESPHKEPDLGGGLPRRCALCQSSDCSEKTCHWKGWCNESDGLKIHDLSATRKRQRDDDEQTPPDAPSLKRVKVQSETEPYGVELDVVEVYLTYS